MKKQTVVFAFAAATLFSSCVGSPEKNETETKNTETNKEKTADQEKAAENCTYNYEDGSAKVNWTAFKTTDKVAVGGQFDEVSVDVENGSDFSSTLESISFEIQTASTNTKDTARDAKIVNAFFGSMDNADIISGKAKSVDGDDQSGTMTFELNMNGQSNDVNLDYAVDQGVVTLDGAIDMVNFSASDAVKALNEACHDLHKGADGVSKTWSEVELKIEATLNKDCD